MGYILLSLIIYIIMIRQCIYYIIFVRISTVTGTSLAHACKARGRSLPLNLAYSILYIYCTYFLPKYVFFQTCLVFCLSIIYIFCFDKNNIFDSPKYFSQFVHIIF